MRCFHLLATLVLVAPALRASVVHVYPTSPDALQIAIDNAAPGDQLFIHGGVYSAITITKALELVADPVASIEGQNTPASPQWILERPITLAGPGSGTVTLQNIRTVGIFNVDVHFAQPTPLVKADAFDRVVLIGCDFRRPQYLASGHIDGAPGIQTSVPELLLFDCAIRALNPATTSTAVPGTRPAIDAANSTVLASDCDIEGGFFPWILVLDCMQPPPAEAMGAAGVVADRLFQTGGDIRGGRGPSLTCFSGGTPPPTHPPGPAFHGSERIWQRFSLDQLERPTLGGKWRIDVTTGTLGGLLVVGFELGALNFDPALGWNLFDPARILAMLPIAPNHRRLELAIPPWLAFRGIDWVAAIYDHDEGRMGGPVMAKLY